LTTLGGFGASANTIRRPDEAKAAKKPIVTWL
jgi:hypothetical protein